MPSSESMPASIRRLGVADVEAFQALRLSALQANPADFGSSYEEERDRQRHQVASFLAGSDERVLLGAHVGHRLVGMVGVGREQGVKYRHKGFIRSVYVAPESRGAGIGRALLNEAISVAAGWGVHQLTLGVTVGNVAALALYRQAGFVEYGREPRALVVEGRYHDEILMVRLGEA